MSAASEPTGDVLDRGLESLLARLEEAEATIAAIRGGLVDAVVVAGDDDRDRIFLLERVDLPYRHFLEHMGEGAVSLDGSGSVVYCNRFLAELVGRPRGAVMGTPFREFVVPHAQAAFEQALVLHGGDGVRVPSELVDTQGRTIPVQLALTASGHGHDLRINIVVTDLGERERIRALRAARKLAEAESLAKDRILAAVSHDLRSPLHVVSGWTALLRAHEASLDPMTRKALDAIERNVRLQTKLLDDILDVARHASGKLRIERAELELSTLVRSVVEGLAVVEQADGIELSVDADGAVTILGDASRIEQVLHNLIGNALKFTPKGGRVQVRLRRRGSWARVSVADTGVGIEPELLPNVFESFRQSKEREARHGGLGLGLAITKSLVELHDGRVWVRSEGAGRGSTFCVELPIHCAPHERSTGSREPAPGRLQGVRILVVDDDADTRDVTSRMLRREGAEIVAVPDAAAALARVEEERFEVVVCDLMMPGTSGFALARELIRRGEAPPVLLSLSSLDSEEVRTQAESAGFVGHFAKPLDVELLCRMVQPGSRS
ncbi:ATP-binding protein [Paraliomyxa miuraensis]|uniref:ATP-binding protein n=1 Tax=Paraliomyxa miuraensis TaxID=376150 RepID=UPI0022572715|nr:ATP-binding protein [Paraliomyxa miuraensis]MCX4243370.1 ATP-binding protein [Paraliomyxa miuraensis]